MNKNNKRPNIVIFNPDQWRGDVMGHLGNSAAITPNIDRLVETDAVSFRNAFCQNPICTPSRCSFMTGWYPHTRGHRTLYHMLHPEHGESSLFPVLRNNGYYVWWGGKNDLYPGGEELKYCDYKYVPKDHEKTWDMDNAEKWRGAEDEDNFYSFYVGRLPETPGRSCYYDEDCANIDGAVEFIKNYDKDQPFCLFLALNYPHPPYAVDEPWFSLIDREKLPPRIPAPENWNGKPSMLKGIYENQKLQTWNENRWNELRAVYYGMCARLDSQFGVVIDALRESSLFDDTAVFLFSDHGDYTGDFGIVEKTHNTFDDCLSRVPLLVKPPKSVPVKAGISEAMVELVDFPATVFDYCGIEPGYTQFGKSLAPILAGDIHEHRDAVFCEGGRLKGEVQASEIESIKNAPPKSIYWPKLQLQIKLDENYHTKATMCRTKDYKYVQRLYEQDEFYDLRKDPREIYNQIDNPEYAGEISKLRFRMLQWYQETADHVPEKTDSR